jgi:hypothetical protein
MIRESEEGDRLAAQTACWNKKKESIGMISAGRKRGTWLLVLGWSND